MDFSDLFPDGDYRFSMGLRRRQLPEFFSASDQQLLDERACWLGENPDRHAAVLDGGVALLEEAAELAKTWGTPIESASNPLARCIELGRRWEPDFLLLNQDLELQAGCVCFPSAWDFEEKMGRPLDWIHSVVPGLNAAIGPKIKALLKSLRPGFSWERANWGLARSPELNLHPKRKLPRLDESVSLEEVWFRVERQALVALPETNGILFGIRLEICSLAEFRKKDANRIGLRSALETMPEPMAEYKNVATARQQLLSFLAD
ncbi:MAG: hypothetical protein ACI8UO_004082 [Verrucomicrobiales bacterium]|jgi:hypothetical protein